MKAQSHHGFQIDFWPGFVDALASLLIVLIFTLVIFMVSQLSLSDALMGSNQHASSLQTKLSQLADQLQLSEHANKTLSSNLADAEKEALFQKLSAEEQITALQDKMTELNQHLTSVAGALETSEVQMEQKQLQLDELDEKLTKALAHKIHQLEKYRSEFFGKLKDILGQRSDVKVVGDRFVFQSEVLFSSASANLSESGKGKLKKLASTLKDISKTVPKDMPWILRIDGHTDDRSIRTPTFPSNWELSAARAIAVVNFLTQQGIPAKHLAATGFGEFHPIEQGKTDEIRAKNRRIEIKFDQV